MIGSIYVNVVMGLVAFLVTIVTALSGNVFFVSLVRAVFAFALFFLLAYPFRWVAGLVFGNPSAEAQVEPGAEIDLVTPEESTEEGAQEQASEADELGDDFTPLTAQRIAKKEETTAPTEDIVNVIRRFTDD